MTFDPDFHWNAHGPFLAPPGAVSKEHIAAEERLSALLRTLEVESVLDVGCGQGRNADLLKRVIPDAKYFGMDLGKAQIDGTRKVRPDGTFYQSRLQDFAPTRKWDLILCSEVLMHVPPADIEAVAATLVKAARNYLVLIEWVPAADFDRPIDPQNWPHDYTALFGTPAYRERIYNQDLLLIRR